MGCEEKPKVTTFSNSYLIIFSHFSEFLHCIFCDLPLSEVYFFIELKWFVRNSFLVLYILGPPVTACHEV